MKNDMKILTLIIGCSISMQFFTSSCVEVKEYQKMYVNDRDMEPNTKSIEYFEGNMELFREGAGGANGGKSGGGCACN